MTSTAPRPTALRPIAAVSAAAGIGITLGVFSSLFWLQSDRWFWLHQDRLGWGRNWLGQ